MKSLLVFVLSFLTISLSAGEVTGAGAAVNAVLKRHQLSLQTLRNSGHKVILGEVTGAGKKVDLDRIKFIVTKKELHNLNNTTHIQFKFPSEAKKVEDVKFFEFDRKKINPKQVKALILNK